MKGNRTVLLHPDTGLSHRAPASARGMLCGCGWDVCDNNRQRRSCSEKQEGAELSHWTLEKTTRLLPWMVNWWSPLCPTTEFSTFHCCLLALSQDVTHGNMVEEVSAGTQRVRGQMPHLPGQMSIVQQHNSFADSSAAGELCKRGLCAPSPCCSIFSSGRSWWVLEQGAELSHPIHQYCPCLDKMRAAGQWWLLAKE